MSVFRRPVLWVLALAVLGTALAGRTALGPRYGGRLRVGVRHLPESLDPARPETAGERLVQALVHDTLLGVGPEGLPLPRLARGWSAAAEGREWTLTLAEGALFHDGRLVTAADAVRSLKRFLRSASVAAESLAEGLAGGQDFRDRRTQQLPGLTASGERHLVLRFIERQPLPLAPLAAAAAAITGPRGQGCGPFVPSVDLRGQRLTLNAFPSHSGGRPYLDEVEVQAFADAATLKTDWQAGFVDVFLGGVPGGSAGTLLLVLDGKNKPFDSAMAQQAVQVAIDRDELVRDWLDGGEAAASLLPPQLLASLGPRAPPFGTPAGSGTVRLTVARDVPSGASQRVAACLTDAGFQVSAHPEIPRRARRARSSAKLLVFVPEVAEPGLALEELARLVPPSDAVEEALAQAAWEGRLDKRRAALLRAEAALRETGLIMPLAFVHLGARLLPGIHGPRVDQAGRLILEDTWREP